MRSFVKVRGVNVSVTEMYVQLRADDIKSQDMDEIRMFKNMVYSRDV
ncbi:hypothetical protein Gogos_012749 [Gossypium gossypioides]|uniref:Uncharacterized protein n=1 Tax=Gossypium gossypioides TaxID=34282 RepID=A0A7J9BTF1_GOSGO|nr:hypothetical protein [Gossypium gossypioides]